MPDDRSVLRDAAALLRRVIEGVDSGELEADGSQGRRLLRRLEGAAAALDEASSKRRRGGKTR